MISATSCASSSKTTGVVVPIRAGPGLRGLADRVEAAGGQLTIVSDPSVGTRVEAVVPCGS